MKNKIFLVLSLIFTLNLFAQTERFQPSIGYIYPAGGKAGSEIEIIFGGQNLRNVEKLFFSISDGIGVDTIIYVPQLNNMQRRYLTRKILQLMGLKRNTDKKKEKEVKLPENPLLNNLENLNKEQLYKVFEIFLMPLRRKQIKRSIQEKVFVRLKIKDDVPAGKYEMRLLTKRGLTNPLVFEVSNIEEFLEREPNNPDRYREKRIFDLPCVINGRIMPGDCDRFYFKVEKGQDLFIKLKARELIPYMADAVPGWFQGILTLYNSEGKEICYADDYYFDPDPLLHYKIKQEGEYIIEVRDALYRGREDFVYRLFIVDNKDFLNEDKNFSFNLPDLPEIEEKEPNDKTEQARLINLPTLIKGYIEKKADIDTFKFKGEKGEKIVFEVFGRRIGSPVDSYIRILDSYGKVLLSNDDYENGNVGLITHFADSYLLFEVPEEGYYFLQIFDIQNHYGYNYTYYIKATRPEPDFDLFIVPSAINIPPSGTSVFDVYTFRKNNFNGEIKLSIKEPSYGFKLSGTKIPEGKNNIKLTITSPGYIQKRIYNIEIEGIAYVDGKEIKKKAIPAEKLMQAFAYYHFVPSEKILIYPLRERRFIRFEIPKNIVKIPSGGKEVVKIKVPRYFKGKGISLKLKEPSEGITIENMKIEDGILSFDVKADKKFTSGFSDNLIIEIYREIERTNDGKKIKRNFPVGFLPAISFEII